MPSSGPVGLGGHSGRRRPAAGNTDTKAQCHQPCHQDQGTMPPTRNTGTCSKITKPLVSIPPGESQTLHTGAGTLSGDLSSTASH